MASRTKNFFREHGAILFLLLFFGVLYGTTLDSYGMFVWDEAEYAVLGRSVLRGEGFSLNGQPNSFRLPLVPLSAAASMLLLNSNADVIVRLPNLVYSLLALLIVYWCVKTQFDRTIGIVAATILGLLPSFWRSTPFLLTEIPFMAFFTGAVLFFSFGLYRAPHFFYWSWLCFGLALSTRYNAVLFAPIILTFLALALVTRDTEVWDKLWSKAFFAGPFLGLALVIPWLLRQQMTPGGALSGFTGALAQIRRFQTISRVWYHYPIHIPYMISWIPTVLVLLGIVWTVRKRDRFALHCLFASLTIILWFSQYAYKGTRLITSVLPFFAILAALGLTKQLVPERLRLSKRQFLSVLTCCLGVIFVLNFLDTRKTFSTDTTFGYPSFLRALQFLRKNTSPDAVLVGASYPQISWYTDRRVMNFPDEARLPKVLEQSEWVIAVDFERSQRNYVPKLAQLFTRKDIRAGHVVVFRDETFTTLLLRSHVLKQRLEEKKASATPQKKGEP
jgi:4-amino-4-deoxy-L-arabinose transferase-like glycosyltransferase